MGRPAASESDPSQWEQRVSHAPGTFYQYNDTRINVLALASLYLLKRPLPEVLDEAVMTPIAASSSWHSEACDNARVEIDKRRMKSVTEAGISGAVCSSTPTTWLDRYLFLQNGEWEGRQLISRKWIEMARSPGPANDGYGFCNCS